MRLNLLALPTCRCSQAAGDACFAAYCASLPPRGAGATAAAAAAGGAAPAEAKARPPGVSLSYVAMCYTLLHELGPVHDVFKRQPQLWGAASLEAVQHELFGWLDAFS